MIFFFLRDDVGAVRASLCIHVKMEDTEMCLSILQSENLRHKDTQKKNLKTKTQVYYHSQATKTHCF